MKTAFTMIEIVFVLVILGILAAVAIPKFSNTSNIATIAKGQADVATIRSSIISERQSRIILGDNTWISSLTPTGQNTPLFDGNTSNDLLMYGIVAGSSASSSGKWTRDTVNTNEYSFRVGSTSTVFTYTNTDGKFICTAGVGNCDDLTR